MRRVGPHSTRRFYEHCDCYIECVSKEAELRERGEVLPLGPYTDLRRENSAIRLCFGLFEYALGIDLPDEVFEDDAFQRESSVPQISMATMLTNLRAVGMYWA